MALDLGELRIALDLDRDPFTRGLATTKRELEGLPPVAQREVRKISRVFDDEGRKSGGVLARGISAGMIRNSPLIAAAVGGVLAAGAPVALAGATTLFGGIGAIAAAQSTRVREEWSALGDEISAGAIADASVMIPVLAGMADDLAVAFQRLRPQLRDAFGATAPLIEQFTDGLTGAAENAMPGLVQAVQSARPVMDGLANLMEDVGTGLSEFFATLSDHAPAAGAALDEIGDVVGNLLPILGELLGQGAELAAAVLPLLSGSLGMVLDVTEALGPALPAVAKGFLALQVAKGVGGLLDSFAGSAGRLATSLGQIDPTTGKAVGGLGRVQSAVSRIGATLPVVGLAVVGLAEAFNAADEAQAELTGGFGTLYAKLREGGPAAEQARQQIAQINAALKDYKPEWGGVDASAAFKAAAQGARDLFASLTPLEQAQSKVSEWTNTLSARLNDESSSAADVEAAQRRLAFWTAESQRQQAALERATNGVTTAMIAQAAQALAAADSNLGYRLAQDQLQGALQGSTDAVKEFGAGSEQAADAALQVEQAILSQAQAAGQLASDALPAATAESVKNANAQAAQLAELMALRDQMGGAFPAALNTTIGRLQQTTDVGMVAAAQFARLGAEVIGVPNSKFVDVRSPAPEQIRQFETLGFRIENLPDGNVRLHAETQTAEDALNYAARDRTSYVRQVVTSTGVHRGGGVMGGTIPERASGGPVWPGTFLVGERGPELVRMTGHGNVFNAEKTAAIMRAAAGPGTISLPTAARTIGASAAPAGGSAGSTSTAAGPRTVIHDNRTVNAYAMDEGRLVRRLREDQRDQDFLSGL